MQNAFPKPKINRETLRAVFASLYSRNYRIYFFGQGVSLIGTWMQNIALSWLVYRLTGSVFLLGVIGFTTQIPTFVLSPFTGVLTDRFSRLRIMVMTQVFFMLQALIMTLLVMFNLISVWHIVALSLVFGVISAFDAPARQSLVIELIDKPENLGNAIALNSAIFNSARLIGPAIAGLTIAAVGEGICFLINSVSFLAVIGSLMMIRVPARQQKSKAENFKRSFSEGFHYTFRSVPIRTLILLLATLSLFGFPFMVLLPAYAKEILHGGSDTLGFLMSALGAGALTGAIVMAGRKSVLGLGRVISINTIIMGCAIVAASWLDKAGIAMSVLFFGGLCMILSLAAINTMLQTISEDDKRGRVMSFYAMALLGTMPIGNLIAGSIASAIGIPYTMLIGGCITVVAGILFQLNRPAMRIHVTPIYIGKGIMPAPTDDLS
jgi:MFS family permease